MFIFPDGFYSDIRIEKTISTLISYKNKNLIQEKVEEISGAFIRLFDGHMWYYSSLTELENIQKELGALAKIAQKNSAIDEHEVVKKFEVHQKKHLVYENNKIFEVPLENKKELLQKVIELTEQKEIMNRTTTYKDQYKLKKFISSKGADIEHDYQNTGITSNHDITIGDCKDSLSSFIVANSFDNLHKQLPSIEEDTIKNIDFVKNAIPIEAGEYAVFMSPLVTGVFTHESFGHKSESDFMVGSEEMKKIWNIGKQVGSEILSIVDSGEYLNTGYTPFDDEGTACKETVIIHKGILTGRLHSAPTAVDLNEELTGNARSLNFEFEPIVRMTSTYIKPGQEPYKSILSSIEKGIYLDTCKHGSGMSTFTIAPARAYLIENGKITKPVKISVVTGDVMSTLNEIGAISQEFELLSFVGGGCGKMEQHPLPVSFGGPYTLVKKLSVQ